MSLTFWFKWSDGETHRVVDYWIAGVYSIAQYIKFYEDYHNNQRTIYKVQYEGMQYKVA